MRTTKLLAALAVALVLACGHDSTGPNTGTGTGTGGATNLTGNWLYSTSNVNGSGLSCSSSGTVLTISHQGSTFSGTYSGGTLTCIGGGTTQSVAVGMGTVVTGSLAGTAVSFNLDTSDWHNTGALSGNSMSGTVTVRLVVDNSTYTLTGNWGASRH
jgi:hypothetical protein